MGIERGFVLHMDEGSFVCKPRAIANFEDVLRRHVAAERKLVVGCFDLDGDGVDVAAGEGALCGVRLRRLRLDTTYTQSGPFLVPTTGSGMRLALDWPVPASMGLRFAALCERPGSWRMGECFLFARKQGQPGFWRLPLPNVFEDGRVCMGDEVRGTIRGDTLQECFARAVASFNATTWNSELQLNLAGCHALFRWDQARQPVAPPEDWHRHCRAVSRVEMEELCPA